MTMYLQTAIEDASAVRPAPFTLAADVVATPIDAYGSDPTGSACATGPQPGATALAEELRKRFAGRSEIYACRPVHGATRLSLHGEGRAVDWYRNADDPAEAAEAHRIIDWLLATDAAGNEHALARRMGIQELIYDHRIWTARRHADGWRPYHGAHPHTDHLHIGMTRAGARMQSSHWTTPPAVTAHGLAGPDRRSLPLEQQAQWEAWAREATARIVAAGHVTETTPLRGTGTAPMNTWIKFPKWFVTLQHKLSMTKPWQAAEEEASVLLCDYAHWHASHLGARPGSSLPANVRFFVEYLGRSSMNDAAARKSGHRGVLDLGGGLEAEGKPKANWCTQAATESVLNGLAHMGFKPASSQLFTQGMRTPTQPLRLDDKPLKLYGQQAYAADLLPGDMVMYLFDAAQYGGHTATVVEDHGATFADVSGNTGDAIMVGLGEHHRLTEPPRGFKLTDASKHDTRQERLDATAYIRRFAFGEHAKLIYSIVRFGAIFAKLEQLPALDPAEQQKVLAALTLTRVKPTPFPSVRPKPTRK